MTVFLSYAHQDVAAVAALRQDLDDMGNEVWIDTALHGGQVWWDEILRQVRSCNLFVLAVSRHSLVSEACLSELAYAAAVHRPFLPVRIDDIDMTNAPELIKSTQHIDYRQNDVKSTKALARALMGVPDAVPLPDVLPDPPPTPQSYRDRYAALLGPEPLSLDDQLNFFIRLSVDIETANSDEAVELLHALHDRDDLSWKVRQRIDRFFDERSAAAVPAASPVTQPRQEPVAPTRDLPPPDEPRAEVPRPEDPRHDERWAATRPDAVAAEPVARRGNWRWWALGVAAVAVAAVIIVIVLARRDSPPAAEQLPENSSCDVDTCSDTPIRFFLDSTATPDQISVAVTDPYGQPITRIDEPTRRVDGRGLQWAWTPANSDPIGEYAVTFSGPDFDDADHTFTLEPSTGPFGVVQELAKAISDQDFDAAADIDERIHDELAQPNGTAIVQDEYPAGVIHRWVPYDISGHPNESSTTIIGAYVQLDTSTQTLSGYCELWTIDRREPKMRSDAIELNGQQIKRSTTASADVDGDVSTLLDQCAAAVSE